ncbi:MAG TPA: type I-C CRISPR-associated protein Cas7/Csd2 [Candidatus Acidoferrales bacterium]|nr:type I-C CRISPR-associated protein Cas7/Csd2 [Candidatus Acidoferrales bacterium]
MSDILNDVQRRHDFVLVFDVQDGNPNGDPDAGNLPRVDPETMHGLVTDVCLKRKVRNYVEAVKGGAESKYKIYVENRGYLVDHQQRAYEVINAKKGDEKKVDEAREWMCANYYDVRTFGAVMVGKKGDGYSCGQVRGPVQLTFGRSIDPIIPMEVSITRVALANSGEKPRADDDKAATGTMGRKAIVPYGLYRAFGFLNPSLAEQTKFSSEDLALFWQSLRDMWEMDRSASRGFMACRALYVFTHESKYGNASADRLFSFVTDRIHKLQDVSTPRSVHDYVLPSESELRGAMAEADVANVTLDSLVPLPARTRAVGV